MSDLRMELIQGQLNDIEENVRSIKATWGNTIMTLDNIKSSLKGDRQKAIDEAYQKGLEEGKKQAKVQAHLDVCHDIDRVAYGNYQKGLEDAWEAITKIAKMPDGERGKVFGDCWILNILNKYSVSEIITILDKHESEPDEIKVSDIITDGKINYLVIDITDKSYVALQGTDFEPAYIGKDYIKSYHNLHDSKDMQKIAEEINKAMKGKQRNCSTCKHLRVNSIECTECYSSKGYNRWESKEGAE